MYDLETWVVHTLWALYDAGATPDSGVTAADIGKRSGLPLPYVVKACGYLLAEAHVRVISRDGPGPIYSLTPGGAALAKRLCGAPLPAEDDTQAIEELLFRLSGRLTF